MEKRGQRLYFSFSFRYIIDMIKKVMHYIQKYHMLEPDDTIIAGISGGADSVCLLFVLLGIREEFMDMESLREKHTFSIEVVHVNHGIRAEAAEDAEFVRRLCAEHAIPYHLIQENVRKRAMLSGLSEEEEGRNVRYEAFRKVLGDRKGKIAVAHNSNDRAETMLFNLFRGAGLSGASGIHPTNGQVIRPLLCVSRAEIEAWLKLKSQPYCTDCTNETDHYTRNRIRHHILPYAEQEICNGAVSNMNRCADQLLAAEEYAQRQTKKALGSCVRQENQDKITIDITAFSTVDSYIQSRIVMHCIERMAGKRKDITAQHVESILTLFQKSGCKELHLPYELTVYKKYDLGMIQKSPLIEKETHGKEYEVSPVDVLDGLKILEIPGLGTVEIKVFPYKKLVNIPQKSYTKWFDYDKITSCVVFRTKKTGDFLTINQEMGHKSLQDYFVNEKIPKSERNKIYLLADDSHILWVPGYRISEYYKVTKETGNILQVSCLQKQ